MKDIMANLQISPILTNRWKIETDLRVTDSGPFPEPLLFCCKLGDKYRVLITDDPNADINVCVDKEGKSWNVVLEYVTRAETPYSTVLRIGKSKEISHDGKVVCKITRIGE